MRDTFDIVDEKTAEIEFFLQRMCDAGPDSFAFKCYLSAYLSASRTLTLAMQRFRHLEGFDAWYEPHRRQLVSQDLSKYFNSLRDAHVHGGDYPVGGHMIKGNTVTHFFAKGSDVKVPEGFGDLVTAAQVHFIRLLSIVYDCYVALGPQIDPQQYFSKERYPGNIDAAECEVWGFIRSSLIDEGYDEDARWDELRGHVGLCEINNLFFSYLGKSTPEPIVPEEYNDFAYDPEDKGWTLIPAGFLSLEAYKRWIRREKHELRKLTAY
jgi:hypothetical protein